MCDNGNDADLIASAPDLLAALRCAADCIETLILVERVEGAPRLEPGTESPWLRTVLGKCRAAIAKAEGRV
jgi:hypothetical protein